MNWFLIERNFVSVDEQAEMDADAGLAEVCVTCGEEHWLKSPLCADCELADFLMSVEVVSVVDEPLHYEIA